MKKWTNLLITMILVFTMSTPTFAASRSGSFSGKTSTPSIHSSTSTPSSSSSSDSNIYRSGAQRPSSQVTNSGTQGTYNSQTPSSTTTPSYAPTRSRSGLGSFLGGMAVGGLLGSMFHPFSGGYGMGGFPFTGILLDLVLIAGVVMIVRRFRRRA